MNDIATQDKIKAIIESCATPKGGWTRKFFDTFGIETGHNFHIPDGWKKNLEKTGDLADVEAKAAAYRGDTIFNDEIKSETAWVIWHPRVGFLWPTMESSNGPDYAWTRFQMAYATIGSIPRSECACVQVFIQAIGKIQ